MRLDQLICGHVPPETIPNYMDCQVPFASSMVELLTRPTPPTQLGFRRRLEG